MFQEAALFPWLTVARQRRAGPAAARGAPAERRPRSPHLLDLVHLDGFAGKRPHELSGGMRQRVALARAFAQDADILLMDEPFGALDAMTRDLLHAELERLWAERRFTVLFVTHNVREAVRLADRVIVLTSRPGRVAASFDVDIARPRRSRHRPCSASPARSPSACARRCAAMAMRETLAEEVSGLDALEMPVARRAGRAVRL